MSQAQRTPYETFAPGAECRYLAVRAYNVPPLALSARSAAQGSAYWPSYRRQLAHSLRVQAVSTAAHCRKPVRAVDHLARTILRSSGTAPGLRRIVRVRYHKKGQSGRNRSYAAPHALDVVKRRDFPIATLLR